MPCPVGSYKSSIGNHACTSCPSGATTPSSGSTSSAQCRCPGDGYSESLSGECTACAAGYQPNGQLADGNVRCSQCSVNTFKDTVGSHSCTACDSSSDTRGESGATVCHCISGFTGTTAPNCRNINECDHRPCTTPFYNCVDLVPNRHADTSTYRCDKAVYEANGAECLSGWSVCSKYWEGVSCGSNCGKGCSTGSDWSLDPLVCRAYNKRCAVGCIFSCCVWHGCSTGYDCVTSTTSKVRCCP
mmetsp:Transcript_56304/g.122372  ORF Transcript_56304/g.122372 Transcript_56304/m.122372 type:complete len:244 (+) Transcript_56304:2122-2853(+)